MKVAFTLNFPLTFGLGFILFAMLSSVETIGKPSAMCASGETYPWYMPLALGAVFGGLLFCGYLGGRGEKRDSEDTP
jgi:hypothetical protein